MTSDLRECCQRAAIDGVSPERHFPHCDARRVGRPPVPLSAFCSCGHVEVLHGIRGNGTRGACSISTGAKAVPCGCKAFAARLSSTPAVQDAADALADEPGNGNTSMEVG